MAAGKATYLIVWKQSSQVYSAASLETAVKSPAPKGCTLDDRRILLASFLPDEEQFCVYPLTIVQIEEKLAEIEQKEAEKAKAKAERQAAKEQEEDDEEEELHGSPDTSA